jgi:hypothetical protein
VEQATRHWRLEVPLGSFQRLSTAWWTELSLRATVVAVSRQVEQINRTFFWSSLECSIACRGWPAGRTAIQQEQDSPIRNRFISFRVVFHSRCFSTVSDPPFLRAARRVGAWLCGGGGRVAAQKIKQRCFADRAEIIPSLAA